MEKDLKDDFKKNAKTVHTPKKDRFILVKFLFVVAFLLTGLAVRVFSNNPRYSKRDGFFNFIYDQSQERPWIGMLVLGGLFVFVVQCTFQDIKSGKISSRLFGRFVDGQCVIRKDRPYIFWLCVCGDFIACAVAGYWFGYFSWKSIQSIS